MKTPLVGEFERAGPFDQRKRPFGAQLDRNVELPAAFKFLVELGKIPRLPGDQIARQAGEIGFDPLLLANSLDPADRGDLAIVEDPGAILAGGADQLGSGGSISVTRWAVLRAVMPRAMSPRSITITLAPKRAAHKRTIVRRCRCRPPPGRSWRPPRVEGRGAVGLGDP